MARRHQQLSAEITDLDEVLEPLVAALNPGLLTANGVGTDVAGQLLVTAGENHERLASEAAFAMLCGVAPIPASSGKTNRHRLNGGGDRQANAVLYRVVLCRLRWDPSHPRLHTTPHQGRPVKIVFALVKADGQSRAVPYPSRSNSAPPRGATGPAVPSGLRVSDTSGFPSSATVIGLPGIVTPRERADGKPGRRSIGTGHRPIFAAWTGRRVLRTQ
ncbi:transposase [Winogradskya consettensis]|uniref:transposase n=1 Tax=Winogradskya consettensis TaxID=113560 RepID=UPI001BB3869A|nr:transposase [Actinoplanes consettensis]